MSTLLTQIMRLALQVLAGVGLGELADKVLPDKVPYYPKEKISPGLQVPKLLWFVGIFVVAIMLLKFVGKKTKISLLK